MENYPKTSKLKKWFRMSRILPMLTIVGSGTAVVLSLIGIISLSMAENIIIVLIALISVDSLSERVYYLEKIDEKLEKRITKQLFLRRDQMLTPSVQASSATEICLLAVHASTAIKAYDGFYKGRMKEGCKIRIILLDPNSKAVETCNISSPQYDTKRDIEGSLNDLKSLVNYHEGRGRCEVRLLDIHLSYSMFAVDLSKECGSMNVEFAAYRKAIDERPHVHLLAAEDPYWFEYYRTQFNKAWEDAKPFNTDKENG